MRGTTRLTLAAALSVWLATFPVTRLTEDRSVLGLAWLLLVVLGAAAWSARRARLPAGGVVAVQLVALAGFLAAVTFAGVNQPWLDHARHLVITALGHMQAQSAPMAPHDGVRLMFVAAFGVTAVFTDLFAVGLRRAVLGTVPPAAACLAPAAAVGLGAGLVDFLCLAAGALAILLAEGLNRTDGWTCGLARDSGRGSGAGLPIVWRAAAAVAAPAVLAAVVGAGVLPTLSLPGSLGLGDGLGPATAQLSDPSLDLRRNLNQPTDRVVMEYQTDRPGGVYLRMASLPVFDSKGWRVAGTPLATGQTLPAVPGVDREPPVRRRTTIQVLDFRSAYLPLPYAPRRIEVDGSWSHDPASLVVAAGGTNPNAAITNLTYTVDSVDIDPDPAQLIDAVPGTPADASLTAVVPPDLPASLRALTRQVTAAAGSAAGKAAAIQAYLRSDRFTYSTEPLPGTGYQALENFLLKDRRGYCEQFATSMAMMARIVGIPTRVAVGFLPGRAVGDVWRVGIRNMHAWPELYFAGLGWVRFEPTPAAVTGTPPAWTVPRPEPAGRPSAAPTGQPTTAGPTAATRPEAAPAQQPAGDEAATPVWRRALLAAGGVTAVVVLAVPAALRRGRRRARFASDLSPGDRPEAAWAEIRDTVVDHGGRWPAGSPRTIGAEVGRQLDDPEQLSQVATLVERSRYARVFATDEATEHLAGLTSDIRRAIVMRTTRRRRLVAGLLPRSLLRRPMGDTREQPGATEGDRPHRSRRERPRA